MFRNVLRFAVTAIQKPNYLQPACTSTTTKCNYARWAHRRPVAIVNEEELFEEENTEESSIKQRGRARRGGLSRATKKEPETSSTKSSSGRKEKLKDNEEKFGHTPVYTLEEDNVTTKEKPKKDSHIITLDENDKRISSLMMKVRSRNKREKNKQILLEGKRLITDAIKAGVTPQVVLFSRLSDIQELSLPNRVTLYKVPYRTIQLWSGLTTSPGVIGVFKMPDIVKNAPPDALPLVIICDNIRDPGNLGSILRVAAGAGCECLILTKGCVDLWDSKVLRSAAGAHFRIPIQAHISWEEVPSFISTDSNIFIADNNIVLEKGPELIEMEEDSTSANEKSVSKHVKKSVMEKLEVKKAMAQLPVEAYYSIDYSKGENVLIIGGETESLSYESLSILLQRKGVRLNIPIANEVDSLNAGVALGIIIFEIKRQLLFQQNKTR